MKQFMRILSIVLTAATLLCFVAIPVSAEETLSYVTKIPDWDSKAESNETVVHMIDSDVYELSAGEALLIAGAAVEGNKVILENCVNDVPVDVHKDENGNIYNKIKDPNRVHPSNSDEVNSHPYGIRVMEYANTWIAGYTVEISGLPEGAEATATVSTKYCRTQYRGNNNFWPLNYYSYVADGNVTNGVYTFYVNANLQSNAFTTSASNRPYLYYISDFALSFNADVKVKVISENEGLTPEKFDEAGDYKVASKNDVAEAIGDFYSSATVTYHDFDGNVIGTQAVNNATIPYNAVSQKVTTITPPTLNKTIEAYKAENGKHYCFGGWSTEPDSDVANIANVIGTLDVYPVWVEDPRTFYTVTFTNDDDSVIATAEYPEGAVPAYDGAEPTMSDNYYTYTFTGWDKEFAALTENVTYKAQYTKSEKVYKVTFMIKDADEPYAVVETKYEGAVTAPEDPAKAEDEGYTYAFDKWVDAEGNDVDLTKVTSDMEVYASFIETAKQFTVNFYDTDKETILDTVTVDYNTAAETDNVPTKESDSLYNYSFAKWVDADGNDVDITSVKANMDVYPAFNSEYINPFTDVKDGFWGYDFIKYARINGLMSGMSPTTFAPNATTTRAMLVKVLYNIEGEPPVEGLENPFSDVKADEWYTNAVIWAYHNGVVFGTTDTTFSPNTDIKREDFATILYRYANEIKNYDMTVEDDSVSLNDTFADADTVASYAVDAITWCNSIGVITGSPEGGKLFINPRNGATRTEMASMLTRFLTNENLTVKTEE